MKRDESRQFVKSKCEEYFDSNKNLCLEFATGVGKSFNAINLQSRMKSKKTFICVAETAHIQNWKDEYIKHGFESLLKTTEILCYASLKKFANRKCDLFIGDEAHHMSSPKRMDIMMTIQHKAFIGLSATINDEDRYNMNLIAKGLKVYTVTMEQAIDMELLPEPKVYLVPLQLDDLVRSETVEYSRGNSAKEIHCDYNQRNAYIYSKIKYPALKLVIHCTQQEKYLYLDAVYNNAALHKRTGWMRHGGIRKRFLSDCKTNAIRAISSKIKHMRHICFCGSIEQANEIGGANSINSKKDSKPIIEAFNAKRISNIVAVKMLVEGSNLTGIEAAIIGQLDGTERPFIQMTGRKSAQTHLIR